MMRSSSAGIIGIVGVFLSEMMAFVVADTTFMVRQAPACAQEAAPQNKTPGITERGLPRLLEAPSVKTIIEDAIPAIQGRRFPDGVHVITQDKAGFRLEAIVRSGKIADYRVRDPKGTLYPTTLVQKGKTICWECYIDKEGTRHCFNVPCPKTGPYVPTGPPRKEKAP